MRLIFSYLVVTVLAASAQTPPKAPSFEVASVKPVPADAPRGPMDMIIGPAAEQVRFQSSPGRIDYSGVTLKMLLRRAYDVGADQISGPDWLDKERYNIVATMAPGTNPDQLRLMLQELLVERFQIRLHREARTLSVYLLTVAKGGPKLKPAEKPPEYKDEEERKAAQRALAASVSKAAVESMNSNAPRTNRGSTLPNATTAQFAQMLSSHLDRPVKDNTQLDGTYSFQLRWLVDGTKLGEGTIPGPSIFAAVEEQLGLKLQAVKDQVEVLIIDHAEKVPSAN